MPLSLIVCAGPASLLCQMRGRHHLLKQAAWRPKYPVGAHPKNNLGEAQFFMLPGSATGTARAQVYQLLVGSGR